MVCKSELFRNNKGEDEDSVQEGSWGLKIPLWMCDETFYMTPRKSPENSSLFPNALGT